MDTIPAQPNNLNQTQAPQFQNPPSIPQFKTTIPPISPTPTVSYTAGKNNIAKPSSSSHKVLFFIIAGIVLATIPFIVLLLMQPKKVDITRSNEGTVGVRIPSPRIQTTPTPTTAVAQPLSENLKTYTNTKAGFSIKYPDTFQFHENQVMTKGILKSAPNTIQLLATQSPTLNIQLDFKSAPKTTLQDFMTAQGYCVTKYPEKQTPIVVGGKNGILTQDITCGNEKLSAIMVYNDPFIYDMIIYSDVPYAQIAPIINQLIATMQFTAATANTVLAATTVDESVLKKWPLYKDSKFTFTFNYPQDWITVVKDYPEDNTRVVNIAKKDTPTTFSISFTIRPNWDKLGLVQYEKKNFEVGTIKAFKTDPPFPKEQKLDQYVSNVYFESGGRTFVFACVHNWNEDYITTCSQILSTVYVGD